MIRKLISVLLTLAMLAGALAAFSLSTSAYTAGDVNGDGRINAVDASLIFQCGLGTYNSALITQFGDLNGDGRVNSQDVNIMALHFVAKCDVASLDCNVKSVKIDGADISEYAIIMPSEIPEGAHIENAQYASEILVQYTKEATGVTLGVSETAGNHNIYITYDADMGDEAFHISVRSGNVYMRCGLLRGPMYAAFGFLEQFLGVKFYPREVVMAAPADKIEIPSGYEREEGANTPFKFRWSYNNSRNSIYRASNSGNYKLTTLSSHNTGSWDGNDWIMQARYGYSNCSDRNHSMFQLLPDIGAEQVVCFMNDKNRDTCEANLRLVIDGFLGKGYELGSSMPYISISENDTAGWCQCRLCNQFLRNHNYIKSSTLVDFLNDMSDRLTPDYPGVKFWTLAYAASAEAPEDMELRDNIYICFAPICHCMVHPLEDNCFPDTIGDISNIDGWKKMTDHIHYWWYGCNYFMTLFYQPQINWVYQNVKYLASKGVEGTFYENEEHTFGFIDLTSWLQSELAWNPDITYEEYLDMTKRFCIDYYGSEAVYDILMLCEDMKSDVCQRCVSYSRVGINEYDAEKVLANYDRFYELYDKAHEEAKGDAYARMNRALLGVESVVISDCHKALYKNGSAEAKTAFTARYENFYNQIKGLGKACYFSYFPDGLNASFPETFDPEITPYQWYIPDYEA